VTWSQELNLACQSLQAKAQHGVKIPPVIPCKRQRVTESWEFDLNRFLNTIGTNNAKIPHKFSLNILRNDRLWVWFVNILRNDRLWVWFVEIYAE